MTHNGPSTQIVHSLAIKVVHMWAGRKQEIPYKQTCLWRIPNYSQHTNTMKNAMMRVCVEGFVLQPSLCSSQTKL